MTIVFGRKRSDALRRIAVWLWRNHSHQWCGTNSLSTTVIGRSSDLSIASMYFRRGATRDRYGDSTTSSLMSVSSCAHRLRNSSALALEVETWTAFTVGDTERANARAC